MRQIRIYIIFFYCLFGVISIAFSQDKSTPLSISIAPISNTVHQNEPFLLAVKVVNISDDEQYVTPIVVGSKDALAFINRSILVGVRYIDPFIWITDINPYHGPLKEFMPPDIKKITLKPNSFIEKQITFSADWHEINDPPLLFSRSGRYGVIIKYFPYVTKEGNIDYERSIISNESEIDVQPLSKVDEDSWKKIKELKKWHHIYDPLGEDTGYLSLADIEGGIDEFSNLASSESKSIWSPYLRYTVIKLKSVRMQIRIEPDNKYKITDEDIQTLTELGRLESFSYKEFAQQLLDKIKKK